MAKKKGPKNAAGWREQAILVKKTHPFARSKAEAVLVAERHAKAQHREADSSNGAFRVSIRPKACFRKFRAQRRGPFVTVTWGELRTSMKAKPECK